MIDHDEGTFYFQQSGDTWYLQLDRIAYGTPEKLKEKKASHTRNLRPMEVEAFHDMKDVARNMTKLREQKAIADEYTSAHERRRQRRRLYLAGMLDDDSGET